MKKIAPLIFSFLFSFELNAQWTTSGSTIYYNGGNVGIGTLSPSTLFHVNGDITAGNAAGGYHLIINDVSTARWALGAGGYGFHIANDYPSAWTDRVFISQAGNIGIGTISPNDKLEINGNLRLNSGSTDGARFIWLGGTGGTQEYRARLAPDGHLAFFPGEGIATTLALTQNGNVGIGTTTPQSKLTVNGDGISLGNNGNTVFINGNVNNNNTGQLAIYSNSSATNGSFIYLWNKENTYPYKSGSIDLVSYGISGHGIRFGNYNTTSSWTVSMVLTKDGKLIVGNPDNVQTPGNYKLYVQDGILTEKIKVAFKNTGDWSDYVFKEGYPLMPLNNLEKYVSKNFHLPGIPSAEQVVKSGVDLGEMDSKLLGKIEELSLYIIDMNKKIEQQQREIEELKEIIKN
jgi:hypothetical protein